MSLRTENIIVERSRPDERLDTFLRSVFPAVSRGIIQRLIEQGHIKVDGRSVKATHRPQAGQVVQVHWPEAKPAVAQPEEIPLAVLYEDADLLVLNKSPGVVIHPSVGHDDHTLVNALLHHCAGQLSGIGGIARPGIVHRLDKDTSGCLVVAKRDSVHMGLSAQFQDRSVEKVYHAVVCGELPRERGEIRAAIGRHPTHRKRMAVAPELGRDAWTTYRVLKRLAGSTLVEASLHTGRTHQIRVHFHFLGHPLVGDAVYGLRQNRSFSEKTGYTAPRQLLHAFRLAFKHPTSGEELFFEAPWPADFQEAVSTLGRHLD